LRIIYKLGFFLIASIWNLAVLAVFSFFVGWSADILGSIIDSQIIRDYAYVVCMLSTVAMFWFVPLATILSLLFKRVINPKFPFFISFKRFWGISEKPSRLKNQPNQSSDPT